MEIPVYSLHGILSMLEDHVFKFLRTLDIPISNDNRGQIALKLNQLGKLTYPSPIDNTNLAMLINATKDVVSDRLQAMIQLLATPVIVDSHSLSEIKEGMRSRIPRDEYEDWSNKFVRNHNIWRIETSNYNRLLGCDCPDCEEGIRSVILISAKTKGEAALKFLRSIDTAEFFKLLYAYALPDKYYLPLRQKMIEEGFIGEDDARSDKWIDSVVDESVLSELLEKMRNSISDEELLSFYEEGTDQFIVSKAIIF